MFENLFSEELTRCQLRRCGLKTSAVEEEVTSLAAALVANTPEAVKNRNPGIFEALRLAQGAELSAPPAASDSEL